MIFEPFNPENLKAQSTEFAENAPRPKTWLQLQFGVVKCGHLFVWKKLPVAQDFCMTPKSRDFHQKIEKVNAPAIFLNFFVPAGGEAPGKVLRRRRI